MKAKLILKSLADLPADTLALAASAPGRAAEATRQIFRALLHPPQNQIRDTFQTPVGVMRPAYLRAAAPATRHHPWLRGGWNA